MINLRCSFCQNLYTVSRNEIVAALQNIEAENLHHYDSHCPRCRHANPIPRERLEWAVPNWREVLMENADATPSSSTTSPALTPSQLAPALKPAAAAAKPAMKKAPAKKAATKKAAAKKSPAKKATQKKTAAKKTKRK
ncbi:MAG TPA: hypothetical protein VMT73_12400 [Anaerolineales bacterium]|nr:hypothetical protein [Anaerolineales bacterium]